MNDQNQTTRGHALARLVAVASDANRLVTGHSHISPREAAEVQAEIERLRRVELAAGNLDRYSLVIESAVRNADPGNSDGVTDAILRLRKAMERNADAN